MRKREYESKLNCLRKEIEKARKNFDHISKNTDDFSIRNVRDSHYYLMWLSYWLYLIQTHKISPKAIKSDTLYNFKNYGK